jgi:hypothetical protein
MQSFCTLARAADYVTRQDFFDSTKPDDASKKLMDSSRLNNLGRIPSISLDLGLVRDYINMQKL